MDDPYAVIARYYDRIVGTDGPDIGFYEALARRQDGPVLELGAGTGRVAVPLAGAGVSVTAVEPSPAMLACGQARAAAEGVTLTWVQARAESLYLDTRFSLIVCALDSFLHLTTSASQHAALTRAAAHLAPGGVLALDLPTLAAWHDWQPGIRPLELLWYERDAAGATVSHTTTFQADPAAQTRHVTHIFEETGADGAVRRWLADYVLRFIGRYELEYLAARAGLAVTALYGDYDLNPPTEESERMIALLSRVEEGA